MKNKLCTNENTLTALQLIANERQRQIEKEGYTTEHDDKHMYGQLALAASYYAMPESYRPYGNHHVHPWFWPWDPDCFKPTPDDRIRELVKSCALNIAEIERLQRKEGKEA